MTFFLQMALSGVMVGGVYALLALGFVLIYKSSRIFNFAQGELLMIGGYVGWSLVSQLGLPIWLTFMATLAITFLLGLLLERLCLRPMIGQPILSSIMMTIAVSYMLTGIALLIWQGKAQTYPPVFPQELIKLGDVALSQQHVYLFVIAMVLVGVLIFFFQRTRIGLGMRATAEEHQVAESLGISVTTVFALSWAIAALTAGIGGILLGSITGVSGAFAVYGLLVFPVVILGGLDSIPGAIIGGLIIGMLEYLAIGFIDPLVGSGFGTIFPFLVMIVILMFKPYGLFGLVRIERV